MTSEQVDGGDAPCGQSSAGRSVLNAPSTSPLATMLKILMVAEAEQNSRIPNALDQVRLMPYQKRYAHEVYEFQLMAAVQLMRAEGEHRVRDHEVWLSIPEDGVFVVAETIPAQQFGANPLTDATP